MFFRGEGGSCGGGLPILLQVLCSTGRNKLKYFHFAVVRSHETLDSLKAKILNPTSAGQPSLIDNLLNILIEVSFLNSILSRPDNYQI